VPPFLAKTFLEHPLEDHQLLLCWLGQAGFVLRAGSTVVLIDPYLSDEAERDAGIRRVVAAPLAADDLTPTVLLVTHAHIDHFDLPTIRTYAAAARTDLAAPGTTVQRAVARARWPRERAVAMRPGDRAVVGGLEVAATFARHSDADLLTQDSLGFLLSLADITVWHAGDTEYDARLRRVAPPGEIDLAILPINGTGGNMNAYEAALLAWQLDVRRAMPMHFGLWAAEDYTYNGLEPDATLDPELFAQTLERLGGRDRTAYPALGVPTLIWRDGDDLVVRPLPS
jgi:L-ascorbate 6-phosphate lactonase